MRTLTSALGACALGLLASCGGDPVATPTDAPSSTDATSADAPPGDAGVDASADAVDPPRDAPSIDAPSIDAPSVDAPSVDVRSVDAPPVDDAPVFPGACTRPVYPLPTARTTGQRVSLQLSLAMGLRSTRIDVCRDRACSDVVRTATTAEDYTYVDMPLARGTYFWRLVASAESGARCTGPAWQFTVPGRANAVGRSWGATLDVNGDGYGDVALATGATVRVFHGSAAGLSATPAATIGALFEGASTPASAGDLNGDGYVDLAVALPSANGGAGEVRVYYGGASGVAATAGATLRGPAGGPAGFGASLAGLGDVDGDGFADLAVGTVRAGSAGGVLVFHGALAGVATAPQETLTGPDGAGATFGASVAGAGDVNNDGFGDLAVGAPGAGRVYVYRGTAFGLMRAPTSTVADDARPAAFGLAVVAAGDVDGDGRADLAVACEAQVDVFAAGADGRFAAAPLRLPGSVVGAARSVASCDANGDGYSDLAVQGDAAVLLFRGGAGGLSTDARIAVGAVPEAVMLSSAGDVQRDGFSDLVVATRGGGVYVARGAMDGALAVEAVIPASGAVSAIGGAAGGL